MVAQDFNANIQETELDESVWVQAQLGLQSELNVSYCQTARFWLNNNNK